MDFLSNGFRELYNELEDGFLIFHNKHDDNLNDCNDTNEEVNNNNTCDYYSFVQNSESLEHSSVLITNYPNITSLLQSDYDSSEHQQFDWEADFLENFIDLPDQTDLLPEKTPLCNESCDLFLKESSENLSSYRPEFEISIIRHDAVPNDGEPTDKDESEKVYPCTFETCTKVYAKPAHLKAHIRRHLGDKPYVCTWPNCAWKFSRSDELARHKRSHSGIKPYKCCYCSKCFARSDHLAKHRKVHERKMATNKLKGIFLNNLQYTPIRPGRKPKYSNLTF